MSGGLAGANGVGEPVESGGVERRAATTFQQVEAILDCEQYSASQKCLILKIRCRVDGRSLKGAFVSNAGLMRAASIADRRTLRAELRELEGRVRAIPKDRMGRRVKDRIDPKRTLIVREERPGRATAFAFTPERLRAIVDAYMEGRQRGAAPPAPPTSHVPPTPHAPHPGHPMQGEGVHGMHPNPFPPDVYPEDSPGADAPEREDDDPEETPSRERPSWKPTAAEIEAGFAEWWEHYPRKEDRIDARKAYVTCVTAKAVAQRATIPQLLAAVKACDWPTERRYTKMPATWLRKGAWQNVSVASPTKLAAPPPDLDDRTGTLHAALEARVGAAVYTAWFTSLRVEDLDSNRLIVSATSRMVRDRIDQHYGAPLTDAARAAFGSVGRVDVTVRRASP